MEHEVIYMICNGMEHRARGAGGRGCVNGAEQGSCATRHLQASADSEEPWPGGWWCCRRFAVWVLGIFLLGRWKRLLWGSLSQHRLVVYLWWNISAVSLFSICISEFTLL